MANMEWPFKALSTTSPLAALIFLLTSSVLVMSYDVYAEGSSTLEQMGTPDLEAFSTYEDMRRYFANRNLRSLRYLENPEDDSYIDAFNKHNEQPASHDLEKLKVLGMRAKRDVAQKPTTTTTPQLLKFEIADAVEPSEELKAIVRQHRSKELNEQKSNKEPPTATTTTNTQQTSTQSKRTRKVTKSNRKQLAKSRSKRATFQQPANFKVKMIPFSIDDAKEPDEATKILIKQARALDLEQTNKKSSKTGRATRKAVGTQLPRSKQNRSFRRSKRAAEKSKPDMFKFELQDAKEPDDSLKKLMQDQQDRKGKAFEDSKSKVKPSRNATQTAAKPKPQEAQGSEKADDNDSADGDDGDDDNDGHESRRFYMYKEAPPKIRKSINSLPHEVQKVITHLLHEPEEGKAYVKYMPAEQLDYSRPKTSSHALKAPPPIFGNKIKPMNAPAKYEEPLRVHSVPVVEKAPRYVYAAGNNEHYAQKYETNRHAMQHPIVVKESPTKVYHSYAADLSRINSENNNEIAEIKSHAIKDVQAPQFKPSKPDPIYEQNKLADEYIYGSTVAPLPIEHLKYELLSYGHAPYKHAYAKPHVELLSQSHPELEQYKMAAAAPTASPPIIKIEYHASSADGAGDSYKSLAEFKELSTLMGKSPEDQIHGLTYLLAKEMQSKMLRQSKQMEAADKRPQDSTSPILFHPKQQHMQPRQPKIINLQTGRLHGLGKTKEYVPIVEENAAAAAATNEGANAAASLEQQQSFEEFSTGKESSAEELYEYGGLSSNYDVETAAKDEPKFNTEQLSQQHSDGLKSYEHVGQHVGQNVAKVKLGAGLKYGDKNMHFGVPYGEHSEALQYASKYAFGYRIRDFHTGNDFGHKQNRDLDGVTRGQYHILLPDGRIQNVIYHADATGFHADVSFESGH